MTPAPARASPGASLTSLDRQTRLMPLLMGVATDDELLAQAHQGYLAFRELLDRVVPAIVTRVSRRFRLQVWDRDDLLQNTYERTWKAYFEHVAGPPKPTLGRLRAWMSTVAHRLAVNLWRTKRGLVTLPGLLEQISPDPSPSEVRLTVEPLDHARNEHGDEAVELWVKNKVFGMSVEELSKAHKLTVDPVRLKIKKVQATLEKWVSRG